MTSQVSTTVSKPVKAPQPSAPVEILDTQASQIYTHVHPALVLGSYLLQFNAIVADPVPALTRALVVTTILQLAYAVICLPAIGSTSPAVTGPAQKPVQRRKAAGRSNEALSTKILPAFLSLTLSILPGIPLLSLIVILFGAPLTTHHAHTLLLASHLSMLVALPLVYVHGVDGKKWREVVALLLPVDEVFGASLGACMGAWFGAVPIPLDWDREWQKWPVTIVTGAYIGYVIGKVAGAFLFKGMKIKFD